MAAASTRRWPVSTSYAASRSRRLSPRETVSCCGCVFAWPRRSNVRHAQPRSAISRARARYCSWLPPQPCTKSTPGAAPLPPGVSSVPAMCWPSTGMSRVSSRTDIRLQEGVLGDGADAVIEAVEVDNRARRRDFVRAISLYAPRAHGVQIGVRSEGFERGDLGTARAADSPRLLKHA